MHGMPSISGTSGFAAVVVNGEPELGTMKGTQVVVNWSSSSPVEHLGLRITGLGRGKRGDRRRGGRRHDERTDHEVSPNRE